jgi:hypothetical protein
MRCAAFPAAPFAPFFLAGSDAPAFVFIKRPFTGLVKLWGAYQSRANAVKQFMGPFLQLRVLGGFFYNIINNRVFGLRKSGATGKQCRYHK